MARGLRRGHGRSDLRYSPRRNGASTTSGVPSSMLACRF